MGFRPRGKKELNRRSSQEEEDEEECTGVMGLLVREPTRKAGKFESGKVLTFTEG